MAFSLSTLVANSDVSADVGLGSFTTDLSDELTSFGDLSPMAQLFWKSGVTNWMAYVTGSISVGSYDPDRLATVGIGHAVTNVGGAYTYFNPDTGWEASATLGLTSISKTRIRIILTGKQSILIGWCLSLSQRNGSLAL